MNRKEAKTLVAELWRAGHKDEARALVRIARGISQEERDLQFGIFNRILDQMGLQNSRLQIDAKTGVASFYVQDMTLLGFPRFLEKFMRTLISEGTKKYKLQKIDRSDPMKVYIKI